MPWPEIQSMLSKNFEVCPVTYPPFYGSLSACSSYKIHLYQPRSPTGSWKLCLPSLSMVSSSHLPYILRCFIKLSEEISSLINTASPKQVFLCLYSLHVALPSLQFLIVAMQVISKVLPMSFTVAITDFFREVRNLAVLRLGRSCVFSFAFLILFPPTLTSQLEQAEISPLSLTPLLPVVELHAQLCELTDPQAILGCWRRIVYLGLRQLTTSL